MGTAYKKITSHGSVSIPIAMRRELGLEPKDPIEVSEGETGEIILRPYIERCIFCRSQDNIHKLYGRNICTACAKKAYEKIMKTGENKDG